jgi:hypothetical protein
VILAIVLGNVLYLAERWKRRRGRPGRPGPEEAAA